MTSLIQRFTINAISTDRNKGAPDKTSVVETSFAFTESNFKAGVSSFSLFFTSLSFLLSRYRYVTGLLTIEKIATIDKLKPINEKRQSVCTHAVHDNIVNPRLGRLVSTNLIIRDQLRLFRHTHAPTQDPGPWSYRYTRHVRTWLPISIICRRIGHWDLADPLDSTCDYSIHRPVKSTSARCVPRSFSLSLSTLSASFTSSFLSPTFPSSLFPLYHPRWCSLSLFSSFPWLTPSTRTALLSLLLSLHWPSSVSLFHARSLLHALAALASYRQGRTIRSNTLR